MGDQSCPRCPRLPGASGSSNGGAQFTINGTGFVQGSTVNLVWQTGPNAESWTFPSNATIPTPETDENGVGTIVQATNVQVNAAGTQITATAPAVTTGPYFFVTVTTPGGTSAYQYQPTQAYQVFTYSIAAPQIATISGSGSVTGGALVTITGSGFYNAPNFATQVWFVQGGVQAAAEERLHQCDRHFPYRHLTCGLVAGHVERPGADGRRNKHPNSNIRSGSAGPDHYELESPTSAANPAPADHHRGQLPFRLHRLVLPHHRNERLGLRSPSSGAGQIAASATVASSGTSIKVSVPTTTMTAGSTYYPSSSCPPLTELPIPRHSPTTNPTTSSRSPRPMINTSTDHVRALPQRLLHEAVECLFRGARTMALTRRADRRTRRSKKGIR